MLQLLNVLKFAWPYILAGITGFGFAWRIQSVRIESAEQDLVGWQQSMVKAVQAGRDYEYAKNVEAQNAWSANIDRLRSTWRNGWVPIMPSSDSPPAAFPAPSGNDGACSDSMAAARRLAEVCAETTLRANALQQRIESQEGY